MAFATMGAFAHGLRDDASWEAIAFARSAVVLLLSGVAVLVAGVKIHVWRPSALWARSIAGSTSMLCVFFSLTRLPVSIVMTLMNLAPVWVAIAAWFLYPQARNRGVWVALGIGLIGVVLIQQPQLAQGNLAVLAPLAASFLLAIVMLALHQAQQVDSRAVVLHFAVVSFLTSAVVMAVGWHRSTISIPQLPTDIAMLIGTGVTATLGQLFLTMAFAAGAPAKVSVVGLTQVGFAMCYDVGIWGHRLGLLSLLGITLVVAPTAWLLYSERRPLVEE